MKNLFASKKWYDLIPDQTHTVVTSGYGSFSCLVGKVLADVGKNPNLILRFLVRIRKYSAIGSITSSTCATAARTSDGSLVVAYLPTIRTITVDMSRLASMATARWYDPTNGEYADIDGSPFANTGSRKFTPPGNNSSGDGDWVLVLETSGAR
jgi:Putative collagen-binding domain of a collagenase